MGKRREFRYNAFSNCLSLPRRSIEAQCHNYFAEMLSLGSVDEKQIPELIERNLFWVISQGVWMVEELLANGTDVNIGAGREAALHMAVSVYDLSIVDALLSAGAEVNVRDFNGRRPLHNAFFWPSEKHSSEGIDATQREMVTSLLSQGADVNAADIQGWTPLMMAVRFRCDSSTVRILLEKGAETNFINQDGNTVAHLANTVDILRLLLKYGVNIHARNFDDRTPLLHVLYHGVCYSADLAMELLAQGVEINVEDNHGNRPVNMALRHGNHELAYELLLRGAQVNLYGLISDIVHFNNHKTTRIAIKQLWLNKPSQPLGDQREWFQSAVDEVDKMRSVILNVKLSLFKFMTSERVVPLPCTVSIIKLKKKFPIFGCQIEVFLKLGRERGDLVKLFRKSNLLLRSLTPRGEEVALNRNCLDVVLEYLANEDVVSLAGALK